MSQDHPRRAGTHPFDFIQALNPLLQRRILLNQSWNLLLVQDPDQGAFIAPRGFTNDMSARYLLELSAQLAQALSGIAELALPALQVKLKGSFGDIHSGIDNCVFGLHSFDRVRTQPYLYELAVVAAAPATVRVW